MGLLANEWIKIFKRKASYIMIALLILLIGAFGVGMTFIDNINESYQEDNWKEGLTALNKELESEIKEYPDFSAMNKEQIAINEYRIEHDLRPPESYNVWRFMEGQVAMISVAALFTIIIAAGVVASEFSWGTIKLLMIRPISRSKILLSKYAAVILFGLLMVGIVFVTSFLFGAIFFGFEDSQPSLIYDNGIVTERPIVTTLVFTYLLESVSLIVFSSLAFMISAAFRNSSLAIGISLFLLLMGTTITGILSTFFDWPKYLLFANLGLSDYINGKEPMFDGMSMTFSIITLLIYYAIFMVTAFWTFTKRDISA